MSATIISKKHTLAVIFIIAATSIYHSQCGSYGSPTYGSSYASINQQFVSNKPKTAYNTPLQYQPRNNWNKFEEVYRWRQLSFSPLDNGRLMQKAI